MTGLGREVYFGKRLPVPGPVLPHVLQAKPQVNTASKVQRSDIHQPARPSRIRFRVLDLYEDGQEVARDLGS